MKASTITKRVDDFILYDRVGKGQFGYVYIAKRVTEADIIKENYGMKNDDELYACKMIPLNRNSKHQSMVEMEREVEILGRLSHPNIIKLHASRKTSNNLYLFMDYCD